MGFRVQGLGFKCTTGILEQLKRGFPSNKSLICFHRTLRQGIPSDLHFHRWLAQFNVHVSGQIRMLGKANIRRVRLAVIPFFANNPGVRVPKLSTPRTPRLTSVAKRWGYWGRSGLTSVAKRSGGLSRPLPEPSRIGPDMAKRGPRVSTLVFTNGSKNGPGSGRKYFPPLQQVSRVRGTRSSTHKGETPALFLHTELLRTVQ